MADLAGVETDDLWNCRAVDLSFCKVFFVSRRSGSACQVGFESMELKIHCSVKYLVLLVEEKADPSEKSD